MTIQKPSRRSSLVALTTLVALSIAATSTPALAKGEGVYEPLELKKRELSLLEVSGDYVKEFERHGLLYKDEAVQALLDRVGRSVAPEPLDPYVEYRFHILRSPNPNAFALPDGQVFVTSGMVAILENEAQLAGVLAHEVTHTEGHHGIVSYRSTRKKSITSMVLSSVLELAGSAYLGSSGFGSLSNYFIVASILGYSRDLEFEADRHGFEKAAAAGYDPRELARVFELMNRDIEGEEAELQTVWSTHPDLSVRALRIDNRADAYRIEGKLEGVGTGDPDMRILTHEISLNVADDFVNDDMPRHAVAMARRLVARVPGDPRCHCALADGLRALGARTEEASAGLTDKQKRSAAGERNKLTRDEREAARLETAEGQEQLRRNLEEARAGYRRALELDPELSEAHRGLGYALERLERHEEAGTELLVYLELAPEAHDRKIVLSHLRSITEKLKEEQP